MRSVLLLNASYEPLAIIPMKRAVSLLLRERVDAATNDILAIRSSSRSFSVPTVLRLRRYINVPQRGAKWSRTAVLKRDGFRCIYCGVESGMRKGKRLLTRDMFTLDHIQPKSRGGRNSWGNTACACPSCNQRKGNRMPNEAGMRLLWEPKIPRVNYWVLSGDVPDAWKIFLKTK